jgi:hypothetical protein
MTHFHARRPAGVLPALSLALIAGSTIWASPTPAAPPDDTKPAAKPGSVPPTTYIDEMIREAWDQGGVKPSPAASDAEFLRRIYLDLLGRIPTIHEANTFLADPDKAKRAKLVDQLLAHPDYARNFSNEFRILLIGRRNRARQVNSDALASWLRRQFAEDRPWNEIAYELLTAEGSNKDNGAANFTIAHLGDRTRKGSYSAVNLTSFTTRVFLGQQIQCTQCHDHPSNDWKQADFWGINAFFKGVRLQDKMRTDSVGAEVYDHTEVRDQPSEDWSTYERRNAVVGIAFPTFLDGRKISQGTDVNRREALAKFITEKDNLQFARAFVNRMWGHFLGRGFVQPVDDMGDHNTNTHPELLDRLAEDFRESGYNVKALIRWITASQAYNLTGATTKENAKDETLFSHMQVKPLSPEQLFDSLLVAAAAHKAGGDSETDRRRDRWLDQFLFTFGNDDAEEISSFQGTIPQALMMMNGEMIAQATNCKPGSFLAQLHDQALLQRKERPDAYVVRMLYLAALSRAPSASEMTRSRQYLSSGQDAPQVIEDLFWSLLNSNEFVLNH